MTDTNQIMSIRGELDRALDDAPHLPRDLALVALAKKYADLIDEATDRLDEADEEEDAGNFARMTTSIYKLGERLERALDRMGMAPAARPTLPGGDPNASDPARAALAALRGDSGAAPGVDYAAAVDPAVASADA